MSIRLERGTRNLWTIKVLNTGATISQRRWVSQVDAVNWCKAVMSSFNINYMIEVADGRTCIEQPGIKKAEGIRDPND